ncbi:PAS domain S-box protein [Methylotenera sp.]|uniref:PAS domain S-box protein n=1 Tax=Methylotenera sp. TaxID=2051956 RepID=UPI0024892D69|nr:PAS domain S-box protein [Methylotenera sp.]MDI1297543.1 PAS domain S-box protein [Methylotenera sp.]
MKTPTAPEYETQGLAPLNLVKIVDTLPQEIFDDLTKLASQICGTPIAVMTLIDENRQCLKSHVGLKVFDADLNKLFCNDAFLTKALFEVTNAQEDERFKLHPLVIANPNIRFYAGAPLITHHGFCLGMLCVIDSKPRHLSPNQRESLQMLGRQAVSQIEFQLQSSALKNLNQALSKKALFYDALIQSADESIISTNVDGLITSFSLGAEKMLGYKAEALIGRETPLIWHDTHEMEMRAAEFSNTLGVNIKLGFEVFVINAKNGQSNAHEWTLISKDGRRIPTSLTVTAIYDNNETLVGYLGIARDITASKQLELSLAKTADILQRTNEMANIGGWELNLQTMQAEWTSEVFRIHEIEPSNLPELEKLIDFYSPEARPTMISAIEKCATYGTPWDLELPFTTAKGRKIWVRTQGCAVIENGEAVRLVGAFQEITAIKQNQIDRDLLNHEISKANDLLTHITNAMPALVAYWHADLSCKFANKAYIEWFGKDPKEIIGTHVRDLLGEQLFTLNEPYIRGAIAGEKQAFERTLTKANGAGSYTLTSYIPDININGEVDGFYVTVVDITELKLQEQKRLADEIAQRELLVSEVHHRIKNNLQGVAGLLRVSTIDYPELSGLIDEVVSQVNTISIIHGLQGRASVSTVRLCELVAEIAASNKSLYRTPILIDIPKFWKPCRIAESEAVPTALVLNELISNAIKYGDPTIGVNISLSLEPITSSVLITISNNGQLPADFNALSFAVIGKGLQLVASLLPKKGALLVWEQCGELVCVKFKLESPIVVLENEELENYDVFKI